MNSHPPGNGSGVLPARPRAGVCLHITSLPGAHGIGDVGDAAVAFVDHIADMGLAVWQYLPTGPTAFGNSPYQPLSAFAGNEMLIGLEPLVRAGLLNHSEIDNLRGLPGSSVDYGRLIPAKNALLARAAGRFAEHAGQELHQRYELFLEANQGLWLADYALYRILKALHGERPWTQWDREYARREPAALDRIRGRHRDDIERIKVAQFLFAEQWDGLRAHAGERRIRLFGDMPIYIALDSADAWARREMLRVDADGRPSHIAGVPPDYFSADGQLWGNPLYDWDYHGGDGYRWWVERLRHAARLSDLVRIDHFRGFESFWSVPADAKTAREGRWEPGPRDDLFAALESGLGGLPIVAEDLGVITGEVDELRLRHHIPGMIVLQFALGDPEFRMSDVQEQSVCYTGTHDNDTTVGWFRGGDDDTRSAKERRQTRRRALRMTGGTPATIHTDLIRLAFDSRARLAVAPMQDFLGLGSKARMNTPGTTRNNWRWRLQGGQLTPEFLASVRSLVEASSRCQRPGDSALPVAR